LKGECWDWLQWEDGMPKRGEKFLGKGKPAASKNSGKGGGSKPKVNERVGVPEDSPSSRKINGTSPIFHETEKGRVQSHNQPFYKKKKAHCLARRRKEDVIANQRGKKKDSGC